MIVISLRINNLSQSVDSLEEDIDDLDQYYSEKLKESETIIERLNSTLQIMDEEIDILNDEIKEHKEEIENLSYSPDKEVGVMSVSSEESATINFSDLREPSNISVHALDNKFEGTPLHGSAKYFVKAEREFDVNAVFLSALAIHESAWGRSSFAQNRNNLFGYQAYTNNPGNAKHFASFKESILHVGSHLSRNYLHPDGSFHSGYTLESINQRYAVLSDGSPNMSWSRKIRVIMNQLIN